MRLGDTIPLCKGLPLADDIGDIVSTISRSEVYKSRQPYAISADISFYSRPLSLTERCTLTNGTNPICSSVTPLEKETIFTVPALDN